MGYSKRLKEPLQFIYMKKTNKIYDNETAFIICPDGSRSSHAELVRREEERHQGHLVQRARKQRG